VNRPILRSITLVGATALALSMANGPLLTSSVGASAPAAIAAMAPADPRKDPVVKPPASGETVMAACTGFPLADYAELVLPTPQPPHNYCYDTTSHYWSVVAVRPPVGADYDLQLYDDQAQSIYLAGSGAVSNTVDFVAVDSNHRPLGDYFPRVNAYSGTGNYAVELAQGVDTLPPTTSQSIPMGNYDVVVARDVYLYAGVPVTLKAIAGNAGQDAELFLMSSDANPGTWIRGRWAAVQSSSVAGPGGTETITFTSSATSWYGLILINKVGNGIYTLQRS
jgi:hypothetical protein